MKPPRRSTSAWSWPCFTSSQICRARMRWRSIYFGCSLDLDGKNLRRHLLERHERPFGGVAAAGARRFVFVAAGIEIIFRGLNRLGDQLIPERQAAFGLAQAKVDAGTGEAGRINPLVLKSLSGLGAFKLRSKCSRGSNRSSRSEVQAVQNVQAVSAKQFLIRPFKIVSEVQGNAANGDFPSRLPAAVEPLNGRCRSRRWSLRPDSTSNRPCTSDKYSARRFPTDVERSARQPPR